MQQHSHNTAILAGIEKTKHAEYENDKREITDHKNDADSNKRNKNKKQKNWETQATHTTHAQTIEILKLLITKNQIIFEQKVIK